jgi:hypothetical protein
LNNGLRSLNGGTDAKDEENERRMTEKIATPIGWAFRILASPRSQSRSSPRPLGGGRSENGKKEKKSALLWKSFSGFWRAFA